MAEAFRVLKPGGRFVVSDIVNFSPIPDDCREALCRITGCTKGMQSAEDYQHMLELAGFSQVQLEPKTVYSLEVLHTKAEQKDRMTFFEQLEDSGDVDGISGSVIIYAVK